MEMWKKYGRDKDINNEYTETKYDGDDKPRDRIQ